MILLLTEYFYLKLVCVINYLTIVNVKNKSTKLKYDNTTKWANL